MKKIALFLFLMATFTGATYAQESRQDVSLSGTALIEPYVYGATTVAVNANAAFGVLGSYRFMLTPSSALEANYGITYQNHIHYSSPSLGTSGVNVNTRTQEAFAAYVRSFNYKRWNPFVEAGPGILIFLPIINIATTTHDVKQQTTVAAFYGGGVAYEISPSFDIRAEFRGDVTKVPNFNASPSNLTTNKWYNIYIPTLGVAYHF